MNTRCFFYKCNNPLKHSNDRLGITSVAKDSIRYMLPI